MSHIRKYPELWGNQMPIYSIAHSSLDTSPGSLTALLIFRHAMCIPSQDLCSHGFLCLEHTPPPTRTHLCHGSTSLLIPVFVQMSCPKTIISNAAFSPTPFTLCCRPFPTIAAINSPHRELESVCPPLNLGWPCDLI